MNNVLGWRKYRFTDTHCGTDDGEQLWYDLEGQFNVCSIEVVETTKKFIRERKKLFRTIEIEDEIKRYYMKIGYYGPSGKISSEILEISPDERELAEEVCTAVREKIAQHNHQAMTRSNEV
ncbi:MAG: hypothetical protein PUC32_01545 [Oscillospiraceae bacterium]|nr:hypothetical protein [Oscillospiraceae bacterium]